MDKKENILIGDTSIEIDLIDLIWRLLFQWKAILIAGVLTAAALTSLFYVRDLKRYQGSAGQGNKAQQVSVSEETDTPAVDNEFDERTNQILQNLEDSDKFAVKNLLRQEKMLDKQKEYYQDSLYINLDANNERNLKLTYLIHCPESLQTNYISVLSFSYQSFVFSDEEMEKIRDLLGLKSDLSFVRQLVLAETDFEERSVEGNEAGSFMITLFLPDDAIDAKKIEEVLSADLKKKSEDLSASIVPHTVKLIGAEDYKAADTILLNTQNDLINRITDMYNKMKISKEGLTTNQLRYYEAVKANRNISEAADENTADTNSQSAPRIRKKIAAAGFILGVLLYVFLYVLHIIFRGLYCSLPVLERKSGTRVIGEVYVPAEHKGLWFLFNSPLFSGIRYRGKTDRTLQTSRAATSIVSMCKHRGIRTLSVITTGRSGDGISDILHDLVEKLKSEGITADMKNYSTMTDSCYLDMDEVVTVVIKNNTNVNEIINSRRDYYYYDIENLGILYFEYC